MVNKQKKKNSGEIEKCKYRLKVCFFGNFFFEFSSLSVTFLYFIFRKLQPGIPSNKVSYQNFVKL